MRDAPKNAVKPMSVGAALAIIAGVWLVLSGLVYLAIKGQVWLRLTWLLTTDVGISLAVGLLLVVALIVLARGLHW